MIVHSIIKCDNSYTQEMENSHIVATLVGAKNNTFHITTLHQWRSLSCGNVNITLIKPLGFVFLAAGFSIKTLCIEQYLLLNL